MKNALIIAGKELSAYFVQPVAYVVLTVFLLLGGFFFFELLSYFQIVLQMYAAMQNPQVLEHMNLNQRVIEPLLHNLSIVLVILVPAITMRSFAEEKRTGTYEFLLTAPVRTGEIVAGKFIAAGAFMLIMIALAAIFPIILVIFRNPELGVMVSGYLGIALLSCVSSRWECSPALSHRTRSSRRSRVSAHYSFCTSFHGLRRPAAPDGLASYCAIFR